ncbi:MAG: ABC transporter ATP-binding protein [Roseobacter sp.]
MTDPILRSVDLTKSFGAIKATDAVSLDLRHGEIHALIGPNGAGKSTLIKQIAGGMTPDAGRVFFGGQDITDLPAAARAQAGLARTFQVSELAMDMTVLQNALLGALGRQGRPWRFFAPMMQDKALRAEAEAALSAVGLSDHARTLTAALSHGQRRLLEVAVALTLQPRAFLMDEPMAGLGVEGSKSMTAFLDDLRYKAPILLVEHDMDAVFALADRISVLVYGRIIATGRPDEIRNNTDVRRAYLGDEVV